MRRGIAVLALAAAASLMSAQSRGVSTPAAVFGYDIAALPPSPVALLRTVYAFSPDSPAAAPIAGRPRAGSPTRPAPSIQSIDAWDLEPG